MAKAKTRKPKTPKVEWTPSNAVCEPLATHGERVITERPTDGHDCPCCEEDETTDVNVCDPCDHVYETKGDSPAVVTRGDIAEHTLRHVLPVAAQMCEEGQLREKMQERDAPKYERRVFHCVEVKPGEFVTVTPLPWGLPAMRVEKDPIRFHWVYRNLLLARCITRDHEKARQLSSGAAVSFIVVGGA